MMRILFALAPALAAFAVLSFFTGTFLALIIGACVFGFGLDVLRK